jgi:hypothetical protein
LAQHFPTLSFTAWADALLQQRSDLWVEEQEVFLEEDDLTQLTQLLATSPELSQLSPPIYPDHACYLAKRLVNYQDQALFTLQEIEANPQAFGYSVYALVLDLAAGKGIAQKVYRVTHPQKPRPGRPDPAAARQLASAHIAAVRRARGSWAVANKFRLATAYVARRLTASDLGSVAVPYLVKRLPASGYPFLASLCLSLASPRYPCGSPACLSRQRPGPTPA